MGNIQFCIYAVDDDEDDRYLIQEALKPYSDCSVTFFNDGESLLDDLLNSPEGKLPALILLDLDMPRVDGYKVLRTLKTNPNLNFIPILVLTATRSEETVHKAYRLGANTFMSKPSSFKEMTQLFQLMYTYWLKTVHIPNNP
ncbi:response regulator [Spirosoma utsteinense]|uniref:CheY-like chemotaxis protein n=1 Tax=Spirosoma utsteinense TaxID=2585773 RepID=A0ABR6WF37_9BACT|nr:response regulator [Spirosoma utsteinense]MBC3789203.1 CheY-like chemotaxis protein [Spirosoma utsteinense]MBC3795129.1 CheY-like chemotaxis protein [Spirosoma utsteinense]